MVFGQTLHIATAEPLGIKSEMIHTRCVAFNAETFQYQSGEPNVCTLYLSHDRQVQHGQKKLTSISSKRYLQTFPQPTATNGKVEIEGILTLVCTGVAGVSSNVYGMECGEQWFIRLGVD